jgi:hypothetical protein
MDIFEIKNADGSIDEVPCCLFQMNDQQICYVIGCDFTALGSVDHIVSRQSPDWESVMMGKLDEQNFIFKQQLINSLCIQEWDFKSYPNPEIIMFTKK